ncbi:UNVERIFIED_CONTAM: hypothetical protein HDU68_006080, partial [Siphonaria sp. JEL0065]
MEIEGVDVDQEEDWEGDQEEEVEDDDVDLDRIVFNDDQQLENALRTVADDKVVNQPISTTNTYKGKQQRYK